MNVFGKPGNLIVILILIALLGAPLLSAAQFNFASVRFWTDFLQDDVSTFHATGSLSAHPREIYWKAASAAAGGDWETVLALVDPLLDDGDRYAHEFAGAAYTALGDLSAAIRSLEFIGDSASLLTIAATARSEGDLEVALQAYTAAWKIDPRASTGGLAGLLAELGRAAEAEDIYRQSLARVSPLERTRPYWYRGLARLLMEQGRWTEAADAWEQVIANANLFYAGEAHLDEAYFELAWAEHNAGDAVQAVQAIGTALELNGSVPYLHRAGVIYEAAGQPAAALAIYRQILGIDPEDQAAMEAVQRLTD